MFISIHPTDGFKVLPGDARMLPLIPLLVFREGISQIMQRFDGICLFSYLFVVAMVTIPEVTSYQTPSVTKEDMTHPENTCYYNLKKWLRSCFSHQLNSHS